MECLISIVVPVYNAEKYLRTCLNSLLMQDIPKAEYEIICINDGSTDNSISILREYTEKYDNLLVIDQQNKGVSASRNIGIRKAKGKYIWTIDSDDWIAYNCLGLLKEEIIKHDPSVIQIHLDYVKAQWRIEKCSAIQLDREKVKRSVHGVSVLSYTGANESLIKRELLLRYGLAFEEHLSYGEDVLFMREFFDIMRIESENKEYDHKIVHCTDEIFYYYRRHDESAMGSMWTHNRSKYMDALLGLAQINRERMQNPEKPDWYKKQYEGLFYDRMFNYMMNWLPAQCPNLKEQLGKLKDRGLYPCPKPSKEICHKLVGGGSFKSKLTSLFRYMCFRFKMLYKVYYALMKRKYQKNNNAQM